MPQLKDLIMHEDIESEFQQEISKETENLIGYLFCGYINYAENWLKKIWERENRKLSLFGENLARYIHKKTFLDIGCGYSNSAISVALASVALGAKKYIGIDNESVRSGRLAGFDGKLLGYNDGGKFVINIRAIPSRNIHKTPLYFVDGDMLAFLARRSVSDGTVFFFSAIENKVSGEAENYLNALYAEMKRLAKPGDIAFSENPTSIKPERAGFQRNDKGIYVFN